MNPYRASLSPIAQATYDQGVAERLTERRRLIQNAHDAINRGNVEGALVVVLRVLERIQLSDESVVQLHRECVSMLEQSGKILQLDASLRPIVMHVATEKGSVEQK